MIRRFRQGDGDRHCLAARWIVLRYQRAADGRAGIRRFVERAHCEGKRVVYWTLNDTAEMAACLATGADGFFTDDVPLGRAALRAAGLLPPPPDPPSVPGS